MSIRKVVIPVAGLGTRGLPVTKVVAKELLPVIDTPTIHFIVEEAVSAGLDQVILVTGRGKTAVEDYFDRHPYLIETLKRRGKEELAQQLERIEDMCEIITIRQKDPLGLGHAVLCAAPIVGSESFAVCLGDHIFPRWEPDAPETPYLKNLVSDCDRLKADVIGVVELPKEKLSLYGIVDVGGQPLKKEPRQVLDCVEKPTPERAPSPYAVVGRYVFQSEIFDVLKETKPGKGGEIQLTDAMIRRAHAGKTYAVKLDTLGYDMGDSLAAIKAQVDCALSRSAMTASVKAYLRTRV